MISYHPEMSDAKTPWVYARGFKTVDTVDMERIAKGIVRFVWSGIVWRDGRRRTDDFLFADFAVFDFDSPAYPLAQALEDFVDCRHVIGTTKSHQKAKGRQLPCDRFRVVIPFDQRIEVLEDYQYTMRLLTQRFDMDRACVDGARYFFPCKDIVSVGTDGYAQEAHRNPRQRIQSPSAQAGFVPTWAVCVLKSVIPEGERNLTVYRVAKDLIRGGWTEAEVTEAIVKSPTYQHQLNYLVLKKVADAVRGACRKVERERKADERSRGE